MENRVYCLYRVSTDKQVDYNDKSQADIPMQRKACHRFAEEKGWIIVHEEQEDGVFGHKVRVENRDKLQIIKEHARQGKFDILLVFMFDRIGRIADETPFVVEWFVKNGGFKGGMAPYGYDLVKNGRVNKWKHELYELAVNETKATVVRIIFEKYVNEGFGAQRIATYLNRLGYRTRTGKNWHHATIQGIICNLSYTSVLRSGESRSQVLPHLQLISQEVFDAAQRIRTSRANAVEQERTVPRNIGGQSLLSGNVFCGHCWARLALTTNGKAYPCAADPNRVVKRIRYICYGKTRKQTKCDEQTGYTAHILDGIIDKIIRQIFERMKSVPKNEIVNARYRDKLEERKQLLHSVQAEHAKAAAELDMLKVEIIQVLWGESSFSKELLSGMVSEAESKIAVSQEQLTATQTAYDEGQAVLNALNAQYEDIISWADMYDQANLEAKKMIVNCLIKRVEVYRDYKLHINFNIDLEQFRPGMDVTVAA